MTEEKRLIVINLSIIIERFVSAALSSLLDIDLKTSKTLGNKSSAFTFKQKLDLLTDIKATNNTDVIKFQTFAEIRNQFAHNFEVHDFTTCLSFLDGREKFLKKNYKLDEPEKFSNEEQLHALYIKLFNDIIDISSKILNKVEEKFINIGKEQGSREANEFIFTSIKSYAETDPEFSEKYSKIIHDAEKKFNIEKQ